MALTSLQSHSVIQPVLVSDYMQLQVGNGAIFKWQNVYKSLLCRFYSKFGKDYTLTAQIPYKFAFILEQRGTKWIPVNLIHSISYSILPQDLKTKLKKIDKRCNLGVNFFQKRSRNSAVRRYLPLYQFRSWIRKNTPKLEAFSITSRKLRFVRTGLSVLIQFLKAALDLCTFGCSVPFRVSGVI